MSIVSFLHRYVFRRIGIVLLAGMLTSLWLMMHWENEPLAPKHAAAKSATKDVARRTR